MQTSEAFVDLENCYKTNVYLQNRLRYIREQALNTLETLVTENVNNYYSSFRAQHVQV